MTTTKRNGKQTKDRVEGIVGADTEEDQGEDDKNYTTVNKGAGNCPTEIEKGNRDGKNLIIVYLQCHCEHYQLLCKDLQDKITPLLFAPW
ncbi:hypothetical protein PROFUN_15222 [Planoprotostelium fungivorum]|uniref:Uncharacterized protein n=1 Tax=Planoprotostelium fungivorum TaxID=1890364 RepID=A0A2P6MWT1_9EUKA|nr:hypothetical protein PROFUN_15222 [Planoprotostelium fungivorum]